MERRAALLLIAIVLGVYGVYHAIYAITMLPDPASLLLLLLFAVQAVLAIVSAFGVWRERHWAAAALLALGVSVAITMLIEAFVLGIIPWLGALLTAIAALAIALVLGAYVKRSRRSG
jgi:hypothetical protein